MRFGGSSAYSPLSANEVSADLLTVSEANADPSPATGGSAHLLTPQNVIRYPTSHYNKTYGKMYGMVKTTVYLPEDLKASLERVAAEKGRSEAELIREAIRVLVGGGAPAKPRIPLVATGLGDPTASERIDELLDGFGVG